MTTDQTGAERIAAQRKRLVNALVDAAMLWYKGVPCKPPNRRQRIAQACSDLEEFDRLQRLETANE